MFAFWERRLAAKPHTQRGDSAREEARAGLASRSLSGRVAAFGRASAGAVRRRWAPSAVDRE